MARVTLLFAVLLIALGLVGFLGTAACTHRADSTWFGLALGIGGLLAISPSESRRKLFMHINVTIGLLGFWARPLKRCVAVFMPPLPALPQTRSRWRQSSPCPA